jgi:hypothetical protein
MALIAETKKSYAMKFLTVSGLAIGAVAGYSLARRYNLKQRVTDIFSAGLTRETELPQSKGIRRGIVNRFERGQILHYLFGKDQELEREEVRDLSRKIDAMERQFYTRENTMEVTIDTPLTKQVKMKVLKLDIYPPKDARKDARIPVVVLPPFVSSYHQYAALLMALHLVTARPVYGLPSTEQRDLCEVTSDWVQNLQNDHSLKIEVEVGKAAVEALGLQTFDLVGSSKGGAIALLMGMDGQVNKKIRNILSLTPTGFRRMSKASLLYAFAVREGVKTFFNAEMKAKAYEQGAEMNNAAVEISLSSLLSSDSLLSVIINRTGKQCFNKNNLLEIKPQGWVQIWAGEHDAVVPAQSIIDVVTQVKREGNLSNNNLRVVSVRGKGANHSMPYRFAMGLVAYAFGQNTLEDISHVHSVNTANIPNSAVRTLRQISHVSRE